MIKEKSIIIGCDDRSISAIITNIKEITSYCHNVIIVSRDSDLKNIVKSVVPDLLILCFANNHLVISNLDNQITLKSLPILCIIKSLEEVTVNLNKNNIIFNYSVDLIENGVYLRSIIDSIFLLKAESFNVPIPTSSVNPATQDINNQHLNKCALELDQKIDILLKVKDRIIDLYSKVDVSIKMELMSIVNPIKAGANENNFWNGLKMHFDDSDPAFLLVLTKKYPSLTAIDLKYCCYLKMNMANDDIRNILGINQESVSMHKYRLKKKMLLSKEQDLSFFLKSIVKDNYIYT